MLQGQESAAGAPAPPELLHFTPQILALLIFCQAAQLPIPGSFQAAEVP